jgi:thiol-disulfide isomerase/thioredoxin
MRLRLPAILLAIAAAPLLGAASVDDLLQQVNQSLKPDEITEPGSTVRAKAIAALSGEELGLAPMERLELRLAEGEAWLDAGSLAEARTALTAVLTAPTVTPPLKERAALAWIAVWQAEWKHAEKPDEVAGALKSLAAFGDCGPKVTARAHTAEAQRQQAQVTALRRLALAKQPEGATGDTPEGKAFLAAAGEVLTRIDQALALLKDQPPAERVPVYALRILAMEEAGEKSEAVQAWLQTRIGDPAAAEVLDSAMTASEKFVGQPAPPLKLKRVDGQPGEITLAALAGKPVLIDFFATWCKPCEALAPMLAQVATRLAPKGVTTIGVTLDTKDTIQNLPAFIAKVGMTYPVIGDGLGWDSEVDDAWHVDGIPALVLVGADGRILATDQQLIGEDPEATVRNVLAAIAGAEGTPAGPAAAPAPAAPAAPTPPAAKSPGAPGFVP